MAEVKIIGSSVSMSLIMFGDGSGVIHPQFKEVMLATDNITSKGGNEYACVLSPNLVMGGLVC